MRQRLMGLILLGIVLWIFAWRIPPVRAEVDRSACHSTLARQSALVLVPVPDTSATRATGVRAAELFAGVPASGAPVCGDMSDREFPNLATHSTVWEIPFDGFRVVVGNEGCPGGVCAKVLDLRVLVRTDSALVMGFYSLPCQTDSVREERPARGRVFQALERTGSIKRGGGKLRTGLGELLRRAWLAGVPLQGAEMIVGRLGILKLKFPAREVNGKLDPLVKPGTLGWIVSGVGCSPKHGNTQVHVVLPDGVRWFARAFETP